MHRSYINLVPVTNKYLAHKKFIQEQENYKTNVNKSELNICFSFFKSDFRLKMFTVCSINQLRRLVHIAKNVLGKNKSTFILLSVLILSLILFF